MKMSNTKKIPTPQEEHEEKVAETVDMITAEDLVEQAVYAANAPDCCSQGQQAENMLEMLGANVMDGSVYHSEAEHPGGYMSRVEEKLRQSGFQTFHYKDGTLGVQRLGVTLGNVGNHGEFYCNSDDLKHPVMKAHIEGIMKVISEVRASMAEAPEEATSVSHECECGEQPKLEM